MYITYATQVADWNGLLQPVSLSDPSAIAVHSPNTSRRPDRVLIHTIFLGALYRFGATPTATEGLPIMPRLWDEAAGCRVIIDGYDNIMQCNLQSAVADAEIEYQYLSL